MNIMIAWDIRRTDIYFIIMWVICTLLILLVVYILSKKIALPALTRSRNEKPVIIKSDIVAAKLVLTIAVHLLSPGPLQQVLVVVRGWWGLWGDKNWLITLKWISCWLRDYLDGVPTLYWLVRRDVGEESVRVINLSHQETDPARRGQAGSL